MSCIPSYILQIWRTISHVLSTLLPRAFLVPCIIHTLFVKIFRMKAFVSFLYSLAISGTLVSGASIPRYFQASPITRRQLSPQQVQQELGSQVSNTTAIFGPADSRYNESTTRWNIFAVPKVQIVVEPGVESDIPTIVSAMIIATQVCELTIHLRSSTAMKTASSFWP